MKFILGEKLEMSQAFDDAGKVVPVTLIKAGPVLVAQIKTKEIDGYEAVQVGFGFKKAKNIKKPQMGHIQKLKITNEKLKSFYPRYVKEFRPKPNFQFPPMKSRVLDKVGTISDFQAGDMIDASIFQEGDVVNVSGITKGKGFQGVVKRHGFKGGSRTHGQKHSEREPGSIGSTWPQRVIKGKRMPGRMGGERVTLRNLKIVKVDKDKNIISVSGAVPGRRGTLLEIRSANFHNS